MTLDIPNPTPDPQEDEPRQQDEKSSLQDSLRDLRTRWAALPVFDNRSPDEILGYDDNGLPS